jgi:hypothetical protein
MAGITKELDEVIGRPPHWLVRWGNFILLIVIGLMVGISCLVRYPEKETIYVHVIQEHGATGAGYVGFGYCRPVQSTRIRPGQPVILHLEELTGRKSGALRGAVDHISDKLSDSGYYVRVRLPIVLVPGSGEPIPYKDGSSGRAEILVRQQRLIDRFFHQTGN